MPPEAAAGSVAGNQPGQDNEEIASMTPKAPFARSSLALEHAAAVKGRRVAVRLRRA